MFYLVNKQRDVREFRGLIACAVQSGDVAQYRLPPAIGFYRELPTCCTRLARDTVV